MDKTQSNDRSLRKPTEQEPSSAPPSTNEPTSSNRTDPAISYPSHAYPAAHSPPHSPGPSIPPHSSSPPPKRKVRARRVSDPPFARQEPDFTFLEEQFAALNANLHANLCTILGADPTPNTTTLTVTLPRDKVAFLTSTMKDRVETLLSIWTSEHLGVDAGLRGLVVVAAPSVEAMTLCLDVGEEVREVARELMGFVKEYYVGLGKQAAMDG